VGQHDPTHPAAPPAPPADARRIELIEQEVRARYAAELAAADICDTLQIEVRIRAEIAQALAAAGTPRPGM
jgi:hypothetical protein